MSKKQDKIRAIAEISPGVQIVERSNEDGESTCLVMPSIEGRPLPEGSELINVNQSRDADGWQKATSLFKNGPAQVATPQYRAGYDRIFGGKRKVAEA